MKMLPDSSITMWEQTAKKVRVPQGWKATIDGEYMPDGKPYVAVLSGSKVTANMVEQFYAAVKGAYDAREKRQEAEADRRAIASDSSPERADTGGQPGPSGPSSPPSPAEPQATVEEYLESKINEAVRRREATVDRVERLLMEAKLSREEILAIDRVLKKWRSALAALGKE